ncbi:hypothetical protein KR50_12490 [Jeotgalibacillus campisalis]|uniref:Uncharacterized protein n=1 Tax=Jeotgalibacillus campisalis TaxID=220754 RepID=A0A0C2S3V7_9BACL|nr:hypothetical protein KR50_12490 [Jeotgalibacillus campisalis]
MRKHRTAHLPPRGKRTPEAEMNRSSYRMYVKQAASSLNGHFLTNYMNILTFIFVTLTKDQPKNRKKNV